MVESKVNSTCFTMHIPLKLIFKCKRLSHSFLWSNQINCKSQHDDHSSLLQYYATVRVRDTAYYIPLSCCMQLFWRWAVYIIYRSYIAILPQSWCIVCGSKSIATIVYAIERLNEQYHTQLLLWRCLILSYVRFITIQRRLSILILI